MPSLPHKLDDALSEVMLKDLHRLRRRAHTMLRAKKPQDDEAISRWLAAVDASKQQLQARQARVPAQIDFPEQLPVSGKRDEIAKLISEHQVVVLAGETGSGKTTQLPKICLQLGLGVRGMIGHTQPRRIAAQTVAVRVAEELASPL